MSPGAGLGSVAARPGPGGELPGRCEGAIRVLIADDDELIRKALAEALAAEPEVEVVGVAADADEAVRVGLERRPDVALIDFRMPGGGGPHATRELLAGDRRIHVIALSASESREPVLEMLLAGAGSYLVKGASVDEIVGAIQCAAGGRSTLSPGAASGVVEELVERIGPGDVTRDREKLARVRGVLSRHELHAVFQPIVDFESAVPLGYEALARFPVNGPGGPAEWFADAAEVGLGMELELAAVRAALHPGGDAGAVRAIPAGSFLSLNVSPETMCAAAFVPALAGLSPERVVIEITEHARVEDYAAFGKRSAKLREAGARLAVDDAGAGHASLRHILKLAPDFIKLDMTLTRGIQGDPARRALASALITFANETGAAIVAEGVETAAEADTLRELGVRYGQGYHFGRPGPLPAA